MTDVRGYISRNDIYEYLKSINVYYYATGLLSCWGKWIYFLEIIILCRLHWTLFQFIVQSIFGLEELASIPVGFQS